MNIVQKMSKIKIEMSEHSICLIKSCNAIGMFNKNTQST